ncbi:MAG TPA: hypothetical protein VIJ95_03875 [Hanamia sp.]
MKRIMIFLLFLFATFCAKAQAPQNAQKQIEDAQKMLKQMQSDPKIQAAMKRAQQAMNKVKSNTQLQNQMAQRSLRLDSLKKTDPAYANMKTPDNDNMQIIGFDSIGSMLNVASQQAQNLSQITNQTNPKQDISHHAESLTKLTATSLSASVNNILKKVKEQLDFVTLSNLNAMGKDTSINTAGTGAFLLASGASTNAALYLICQGILKSPKNPWAINDLGVYYRDQMDIEKALQCYFYANVLDTGKNTAINTNIGWAAAYYGDFDVSEKYFDKALAIDSNFTSANEGEAMLAYARGDFGALWKILAKEVKNISYNSSTFDDGLSDDFATTCANAATETEGNLDNQTTDPTNDPTFDNPNPDDGNSQDPPPGADVDDIQYKRYKKVFVSDPKQIMSAIGEGALQNAKSYKELQNRQTALLQEFKSLKPLVQMPYIDDEGNLVYPNRFSKYVDLLTPVEISFEKRKAWYINKLEKKLELLRKDVINHDMDMGKQYSKDWSACGKLNGDAANECVQEVQCKWIPQMYKSKNSDLDAIANLWNEYYDHTANAIQWYIDASAPFISRVHDAGWNQYLNDKREFKVRAAIIQAYGWWLDALGDIASNVSTIQQNPPACPAVEVAGVAPDPFSKKPKHIKEFEGYCYDIKSNAFGSGLSEEETCHATTISFEKGPIKVFYTHVNEPIYAQNNGYTNKIGTTISASKDIDIVKLEGKDGEEKSIVSASAGIEGSVDLKFDNNWDFTSGSTSISASGDIGGISMGGISATRTVEMVAGQLQVNPLSVTTSGPLNSGEK